MMGPRTDKELEMMNHITGCISFMLFHLDTEELERIDDILQNKIDEINKSNINMLYSIFDKYFMGVDLSKEHINMEESEDKC